MTSSRRRTLSLVAGAALCALPACSTREIGSDALVTHRKQTGPNQAALLIVTCPDPDYVPYLTTMEFPPGYDPIEYTVFIDGRQLVFENRDLQPTTVVGGDVAGDLAAGPHHFAVTDARGGPILFEGDAAMAAGTLTRLYLFGQEDAPKGLFVSYPLVPPLGNIHVNLTNLAIDGASLEVVRCDDATHCAPVSSPLAVGDTFDANFSRTGFEDYTRFEDYTFSRTAAGVGIGFRLVPTAALPDPPIIPLYRDHGTPDVGAPENFTIVAMLMLPDGTMRLGTN